MNNFLALFRADLYKYTRNKGFFLIIFIPAILIPILSIVSKIDIPPETFQNNFEYSKERDTHLYVFLGISSFLLFLSLFLATLFTCSLIYFEDKAGVLRYAFLSHYSFATYIIEKVLFSIVIFFCTIVTICVSNLFFIYLLDIYRTDLSFPLTTYSLQYSMISVYQIFIKTIPIIPFLWLVGMLTKHYITISFFLSIFGIAIPPKWQLYSLNPSNFSRMMGLHTYFLENDVEKQYDWYIFQKITVFDVMACVYFFGFLILCIALEPVIKKQSSL
jgi:hypothetical protein